MLLIYADLNISFCWVGAVDIQLTCRPCLSLTSGGISWTKVVLRGFTQQLSSGLSSGRTRQYTFTNHKISYISSDSFQFTALSVLFAIMKFFSFFNTILTQENLICKNDIAERNLENHKNPIFVEKKGYKSILFTQNLDK